MRFVKRVIFVDTSVLLRYYFAFVLSILEYCSPVWVAASECLVQLLDRQVYSEDRLCPDQSFLSLCHRRQVASLVCCTWLILTLFAVCSASFHLLLLEFNIPELRPQLIYWSLKVHGVERPNLLGISCLLRFKCDMTFPIVCSTPERWMGSRVQATVGCFPEMYFLFPWRRC